MQSEPSKEVWLRKISSSVKVGLRSEGIQVRYTRCARHRSSGIAQLRPRSLIFGSRATRRAPRVAKARNLPLDKVRALIAQHPMKRQFGLLGAPRVNVLELNRALDNI